MNDDQSNRVKAGLQEAATRARYPGRPLKVTDDQIRAVLHLGTAAAARAVGLSRQQLITRRRRIEQHRRLL